MKSVGKFVIFIGSLFRNMESIRVYPARILDEMILIGINSVFIVAIVSTFIGAVTAVQTAYNLVSPLVPLYIIGTVVRDMTVLELAPTITCIVLAGKVGSNIAGELGTMRITEQIDALEVMGINSSSYLVLPKILAAVIMFPMLVILSGFLSLLGGYLAATLTGAMTEKDYIYGIRYDFVPYNVTFALIKSVAFAFLISSISSFKGFFTTGGALEVGQASTNAVTNSCIAVLLADYLLAQLLL
ncbi:phospholipid/cholesterol/gamma-HCH transport system permease protein [Catalinimonas alkaloidigena]|uniref:Phospholipid/cholesterol/gamma-HCH transport system permease protein n=1 Tax=Catalinimonas alkaloidigena TaxID=1075417 RepID=A0A1G9B0P3_9BACT|nr:ABC transporter permease [Catalinimonas alkaloidigena]SDK32405.1 phospholipid/cholesterol/gamma-HCH transport system permease protein [Catalinimonas alkaloidigena]